MRNAECQKGIGWVFVLVPFWFPFLLISSNPKQSINTLKSTVQIVSLLQEPNAGGGFWCCLVVFQMVFLCGLYQSRPQGSCWRMEVWLLYDQPNPPRPSAKGACPMVLRWERYYITLISPPSLLISPVVLLLFSELMVSQMWDWHHWRAATDWSGISLMSKNIWGTNFAGVTRLQGQTGNTWAKKRRRIRLEPVFYNHRIIIVCSIISLGIAKIFFLC